MRTNIRLMLLIAISPAFMAGCSYDRFASFSEKHEGIQVSPSQYSSLQPGQTASVAVKQTLGAPSRVQKKAGREVWVYTYHRFNSNPMITNQDSYQVVFLEFDSKGVLAKRWRKETSDEGNQ